LIRFLNAYFPKRTFFLGLSEACLVAFAFLVATFARLGTVNASIVLSDEQGLLKIFLVSAPFVICMYYFDLYDSSVLRNRREVNTRLIQVLGTTAILLAAIYYLYPRLELGRGIVAIGFVIAGTVLALWRGLFSALNCRPDLAERTMIFGDGVSASKLLHEVESRPELGLTVVGSILVGGNGHCELRCDRPLPSTPPPDTIAREDLATALSVQRVKRIIVALDDRRGKLPVELLLSMKSHGVFVQDGTEFYEQITGKIPIESLRLGSLLFSSGFHVSRFLASYERLASVVVSVIGLVFCLPLLPFVALAIKLTSPGPLLYHQARVGRDGVVFHCHKFRTMRADAEADTGPTWVDDEDPRITFVGRFLRLTRLDEIPQLWNVLKGEMSLIGPRPERPEFIEWLKKEIPFYDLRHVVRPGITGWAQVRYKYGNSIEDAKEKLRYDLFYIKNISPGLDALIFFHTVKTILLGRGAR
jgi:sugar transferase (PEP-CTERM system associated)